MNLTSIPEAHQAVREVIPVMPGHSFRFVSHDYPSDLARWNYHPEFELHLIREGSGTFIIGDRVGQFSAGHVALVGPDLPHDWMSHLPAGDVIVDRDAVIQFSAEWFAACREAMPELADVQPLLEASGRGIIYSGATAVNAADRIEAIGRESGPRRASRLLDLLCVLAEADPADTSYVLEVATRPEIGLDGRSAVEAGMAYILDNLTSDVRMSEAARLAHMSEPTFSRYFKRASGVTFSHMVRRLRIASACRLLSRTDTAIADICHEVGYTNVSNFNRQFRSELGVTPREYRANNRWPVGV